MRSPYKSMFPRAGEVAYLDTAAEGLPLPGCEAALREYFADKSQGTPGRRRLHAEETAALGATARLLGTDAENVALLSSTSDALNLFANSIEWHQGDEVVVSDLEFPSGVLAWLHLRRLGVRVRVIPSGRGKITLDDFAAAINPATRVVCVSHVSYKTGARIAFLSDLAEAAHRHGALFVVDATQSLGRVRLPLDGIDFLVASAYKWLLGPHGAAVVYLAQSARARISDGAVGWYSVSNLFTPDRFECYQLKPGARWMACGMPAFPSIYALRRALEFLLEKDIAVVDGELRPLVAALREGISSLGLRLLTPPEAEFASGIVSFQHARCERIGASLEQRGVIVWAGDGRVRASVHLYNDREDVDRLLHALGEVVREEPE